ncbi:phage integrase family protein [Persicimonas caeni]|uniref:Phage integrase family protein n=1 Tax=Persicimonas caeni TaxID=2292766 RepID=A0A4Y6PLS1_PERCE|nr:tyrosine-type recombinase/integrase [Persicimonas caeni]QDG49274.1 phage integrase family protein [Persicimonas caeni]QED30495.1 phage integrase family protein [Persicimonas caeni]
MGKAIEPCIYPVKATKRYPAGFRVRKVVVDQWGEQRQITEIIRPIDESSEAKAEALEQARALVKTLERDKRTGRIFRRFDDPVKRDLPNVGYGINWSEYTPEEALALNRELKEEALEYQKDAGSATMREFAEETFLPWYEANTSKSNFQKKRAAWKAVLAYDKATAAGLGHRKLSSLRPSEIDDFVSWLAGRQKKDGSSYYSKSSIKGYFAVVRSLVKQWAADEGKANPADPAKLKTDPAKIKGRNKTEKVAGEGQLAKLEKGIELAISKSQKRYLYCRVILRYLHRVLTGTGMRVSEALFLRTEHVDWDGGTITIEGAAVDGVPGPTKTGKKLGDPAKGVRVIPMSEAVASTLREWLDLREQYDYPSADECPTIFCTIDGGYYTDDQVRDYYKRARKMFNKHTGGDRLEKAITPHDLRHTFNDRLRKAGVPSEVREAILGHADGETNRGYTNPKALEGRDAIEAVTS